MKQKTGGSGMSFLALLAILFIGLKLSDHIDWSWWWVLCPLWGPVAIMIGFIFGACVVFAVGMLLRCFLKD